MTHYEGRHTDLKNRVNKHLVKLTGQEIDYYSKLKQSDLIELKTVLADINNVLTFKMTLAAAKWICKYFKLDKNVRNYILQNIDNTKPNSKGFDIHITEPYKIIAEVKCTSPINNGSLFGVAQHDSIMTDVFKLVNGKESLESTTKYYKFLFIIDLGDRTEQAISQLIKETKGKTTIANKFNALKKNNIILFNDRNNISSLNLGKVYIKKIRM